MAITRRRVLGMAAAGMAAPLLGLGAGRAQALDESTLTHVLQRPDLATHASFGTHDSAGQGMDGASVVQLRGVGPRYAAVYHTGYAVAGGRRFRVNLAVSDDLRQWTFVRTLLDNCSMPKITRVRGADWIVVAHEQWAGGGSTSASPQYVSFRLYYSDQHLLDGSSGSTYTMPRWAGSNLNGTPSFYDAHITQLDGYYSVNGQYGFHFWNGSRDVNGTTTIRWMFDPRGDRTVHEPSTMNAYNAAFRARGVSGNLGQRDTLALPSGRFSVQEGNIGTPAGSWDRWRVWLYRHTEPTNYPTGAGVITPLSPVTPGGSVSFGNPGLAVLDAPDGVGQVLWVSYYLFGEGAAPGEGGPLLYWTRL